MLYQLHTVEPPSRAIDPSKDPANVPAHVIYHDDRRATVWHPHGPRHINVALTIRRLLSRGYTITPPPAGFVPPPAPATPRALLRAFPPPQPRKP